jgi:Mn2+/Fe2+ NRAMP family transporter
VRPLYRIKSRPLGPLMAIIMIMASSRKVMGRLVIPPYLRGVGWVATIVMCLAAVGTLMPGK